MIQKWRSENTREGVERDAGTRDLTAYQISTRSLLILDGNVGKVPSDILDVS
jgi:hypothetical protein